MIQSSDRRRQVLDLRIRLERAAAAAFDGCCLPGVRGQQSNIKARLLYVVAFVDDHERPRVRRLARLGAHVYARSSDVLHGRVRALDVDDIVVTEWRAVVEEIERYLAQPREGSRCHRADVVAER